MLGDQGLAPDHVVERTGTHALPRELARAPGLEKWGEGQSAAQHEAGGLEAAVMRIDEAQVDLAFIAEAGAIEAHGILLHQADRMVFLGGNPGRANPLQARPQNDDVVSFPQTFPHAAGWLAADPADSELVSATPRETL